MKCLICDKEFKYLTTHLTKFHKISYQEYYLNHLKGEVKFCKVCSQPAYFTKSSYKDYCSKKCMNILRMQKVKQTNFERYGTSCTLNIEGSIEKKKQTWLKKYGVDNPSKCEEIKRQKVKTCFQHNGVDTVLRLKEVREKGDPFSEKAKQKRKETSLRKYGVLHPLQNEQILKKQQDTNLQKYHNVCSLQSVEIKEKVKHTWIQKYGVDNPSKNALIIKHLRILALKREQINREKMIPLVEKLLENNDLTLLDSYLHSHLPMRVQCKKCGTEYKATYCNLYQCVNKCPKCYPPSSSIAEKELADFVQGLGFSIERNTRKIIFPHELDIYVPEKNIAIEYNGLYWHSELSGKSKTYHVDKLNTCIENNVRLIQIFEDEWKLNRFLTENRLKQILNVSIAKRVHARKCKITEIDNKLKNEFLFKYHIQGPDISNVRLGAFYENELIALMTFSHGSIAKGSHYVENRWELSRFCSNYMFHIPGIASKLLSYFKKNFVWNEIFSYADLRWSDGDLYYKLGFNLAHITKPNYWYIKNGIRMHRFGLRKRPDEPKNIPEYVLRAKEGYARIWDCGNLKMSLTKD